MSYALQLTHTRRDGTLLYGTHKGDGSGDILAPLGFQWSSELGMWYLPSSRDKRSKTYKIGQAVEQLENAGWSVATLVDDITPGRTPEEIETDLAERSEDRADRYSDYSRNAAGRSNAAEGRYRQMADAIPIGQPVMGAKDAKNRERIRNASRRSWKEGQKADRWEDRQKAIARRLEQRYSLTTTANRIQELEATERRQLRWLAEEDCTDHSRAVLNADLDHTRAYLDYWRKHLAAKQAETGKKVLGPDDVNRGDFILQNGRWFEIKSVNKKSVSVPWILMGLNRTNSGEVWTIADAKRASIDGVDWDTVKYQDIRQVLTAAEIRERFPEKFATAHK